MSVPDAERLGSNAGTAEPMGVSPPEAVAYQVLVIGNALILIKDFRLRMP
jgi:hypothetical protein